LVADGYYYRFKFWNAVRDADLNLIGKLRVDANLNYIYTGEINGALLANMMVRLTVII